MKVDHLIIGAGLAGIVLKRSLGSHLKVVLIDAAPGSWKIGEANAPEMFYNPILDEVLHKVKALPSYSRKDGSLFIGPDSAAFYPIQSNPQWALHVARDELEQLLIKEWEIPVEAEHVESIDLARNVVVTNKNTYEVSGQIIDCSGGAMIIARQLGEARALWPIHSAWRYYDVVEDKPERFWEYLRETKRSCLMIDIPKLRILPPEDQWVPRTATTLTRVRDGMWMWQIALFDGKMLSVGIVSRHGPVSEAELDSLVKEYHARNYTLRERPTTGETPYDRFHQRSSFAMRAGKAASTKHILVGDAYMFIDPVYSVGTTIAVNKALEVAAFLNRRAWSEQVVEKFNNRYEMLLKRRTEAFRYWYSEDHLYADPSTARVRKYFPEMTPFQAGISWQYAEVVTATLKLTAAVRTTLGAKTPKNRESDKYTPRHPRPPSVAST